AKCIFIEEDSGTQAERPIEVMVGVSRLELWRVNAELLQQAVGYWTIRRGAVDEERSSIQELKPAAEVELVSLGMASKVVVVLKNEDPSGPSCPLAKKVGGGQTADPSSNHHQAISFPGVH